MTTLSFPAEKPSAAPHALSGGEFREESDNYGNILVVLHPKLRVIRSRCNIQWIVQSQSSKRNGQPIWTSFAYCATKEGLLLRLPDGGHGCDPVAWRVVEGLPDYYPKQSGRTPPP